MKRLPVLCLTRLNLQLQELLLLHLFKEHCMNLEDLSTDLNLILTETTLSDVYRDAFLLDLSELLTLTSLEVTILDLHSELDRLLKLIRDRMSERFPNVKPRSIQLALPDTLIVETLSDLTKESTTCLM